MLKNLVKHNHNTTHVFQKYKIMFNYLRCQFATCYPLGFNQMTSRRAWPVYVTINKDKGFAYELPKITREKFSPLFISGSNDLTTADLYQDKTLKPSTSTKKTYTEHLGEIKKLEGQWRDEHSNASKEDDAQEYGEKSEGTVDHKDTENNQQKNNSSDIASFDPLIN